MELKEGWLLESIKEAHHEVHIWYDMIEVLQLVKMEIKDKDLLKKVDNALIIAENHYKRDIKRYGIK